VVLPQQIQVVVKPCAIGYKTFVINQPLLCDVLLEQAIPYAMLNRLGVGSIVADFATVEEKDKQ
jgi:hypothetical protein